MAPLFSKVDLNKLWRDVQNEETLICAKFGKDLFNISKVIGLKRWPSFFDLQCSLYFITARQKVSNRQIVSRVHKNYAGGWCFRPSANLSD